MRESSPITALLYNLSILFLVNTTICHLSVTPLPNGCCLLSINANTVHLQVNLPNGLPMLFSIVILVCPPPVVGGKMVQCVSCLWRLVSVIGICCYYHRMRIPS